MLFAIPDGPPKYEKRVEEPVELLPGNWKKESKNERRMDVQIKPIKEKYDDESKDASDNKESGSETEHELSLSSDEESK